MRRLWGRATALFVVATLLVGLAEPALAASTVSVAATEATTSGADEDRAEALRGLMDKLLLTVASSPLLVRVVGGQLQKYGSQKLQTWARESYFVVGQVVAEAQRSGVVGGDKMAKAELFRNQFGSLLQEAGWLERMALRTKGSETQVVEQAMKTAEQIHHKTFHGQVAELEAAGRISWDDAVSLLELQRRGLMTPRDLGAHVLRQTGLRSSEVLDLMRTYQTTADVRVQGRDSHYDASVLELLEPWREARRARFSTRVGRETVAKLLAYRGDLDGYTKLVLAETGMTGPEARRIVDEYGWELRKDAEYRARKAAGLSVDAEAEAGPSRPKASSTAADADSGPSRPKASSTAADADPGPSRPKASSTVADADAGPTRPRASAAAPSSGWSGGGTGAAKASIRYDLMRGGILVDVGMTAATNLLLRMKQGQSVGESVKGALGAVTTVEFIVGDLVGGTAGAALGAMIPLPGVLGGMGMVGSFLRALPTVGLTIAGAQLGFAAVSLWRRGQFSFQALMTEVRPGVLLAQALGAALGMTLGGALLPGPLGTMLGGIVGGMLAVKLTEALTGESVEGGASRPAAAGLTTRASSTVGGIEDLNLDTPSAADMVALDERVKAAYADYVAAQRNADYTASVSHFRRYLELQRMLGELVAKGYSVR